MLKIPVRPHARGHDLEAIRRALAEIREAADSAVQHEMNRVELAFPDLPEPEKRRLICHAARPHREREDSEVGALVAELGERDCRQLFDETLDPRLLR